MAIQGPMERLIKGLPPEHVAYFEECRENPWKWGELVIANRETGENYKYWPHQKEDLECKAKMIVHQDAADVGKTTALITDIIHFLCWTENLLGLCIAPISAHYRPIIDEIKWQIDQSPLLQEMFKIKGESPYFWVQFKGGSRVDFRPAGIDGDAFKAQHVHKIWIDEAARISKRAWHVMLERLVKTYKKAQIRAYCYPDGRRDTEYYKATQDTDWKVFKVPQSARPDWDAEKEREARKKHGDPTTPEYQHMVMGEHGRPCDSAFNQNNFAACQHNIPGYKVRKIEQSAFHNLADEKAINERINFLFSTLPLPKPGYRWLGLDPAYTADPCEYVIWSEDDRGHMTRLFRIHTEKLSHPIKAKMIAALDRIYHFNGIGIDNGGDGISIIDDLLARDEFKDLRGPQSRLEDRLYGFSFGSTMIIDVNAEDGAEIKQNTKVYATNLLNAAMQRRSATWPVAEYTTKKATKEVDPESESQYINQTYTLTDRTIVYSKGNDHIIDADRCAWLVRETVVRLFDLAGGYTEISYTPPALTNPIF